jgi:hypothetical protein
MSEPQKEDQGWEAPWDDIGQRGWQPAEMKEPRPPERPAEPPSPATEPPAEPPA